MAYPDGPATRKPAAPVKPAAAPPPSDSEALMAWLRGRTLPAGLPAQAQAMAGKDVNAAVQGIRQQQGDIRQAGQLQAGAITDASLAAAKYLQSLGLGDKVAADYSAAAAAERAAAAGYSGGLQQTVGDAAARVQANLAKLRSQQQVPGQGAAAGNVLYGLGGNLPAQGLDAVGPLVAAGLRSQPGEVLGFGQQQAAGALGAAGAEAAKLNPDIIAAQAKRSAIAAAYLEQLEKAALEQGNADFARTLSVMKLRQQEAAAQATQAWRDANIEIDRVRADNDALYKQGQLDLGGRRADQAAAYQQGQLALGSDRNATGRMNAVTGRVNANTSRINALKPEDPNIIGTDATGRWTLDPATGRLTRLPGPLGKPVAGSEAGPGGLTPASIARIDKTIAAAAAGKPPERIYDSREGEFIVKPGTGRKPVTYQQALAQAISLGPATPEWTRKAKQIVDNHYPPGKNGRPKSPAQVKAAERVEVAAARDYYAEAKRSGQSYDEAVGAAIAGGADPVLSRRVAQSVYGTGAQRIPGASWGDPYAAIAG